MDMSVWTSHFDGAATLWEEIARSEGISRHERPISASAARKFADELLLLTTAEELRDQIRRDPKGARSFAEFLHAASDGIHSGDLPEPPTLSEEHMPFYLPTFGVKEAIRYFVALGRGDDYKAVSAPLDS
jgi:hypothetical protein